MPASINLMQRVDLQYNQIRNIHPKAFQKLVRLVELCLGNNLLPGLAPRVLASLQKLRVLNLQWQRSEQVESGLLLQSGQSSRAVLGPELSSGSTERARLPLKNMHLENNHLHTLGRDAFSGLGLLRLLNLSGNLQGSLRHPATVHALPAFVTLVLLENHLQQVAGQVLAS